VTSELSSNLLRPANFPLCSGHRHFCANLLNLSKFRCRVKPRFGGNQDHNISSTAGRFSCLFDRHSGRNFPAAEGRTAQNFKQQPAMNRFARFARTRGSPPGSCNGVCSLWDSLQGSGVRLSLPHPTLRTGFPLPTWGRPHRPREAPLLICNSSRIAQAIPSCKSRNRLISRAVYATFRE